MGHHGIAHRLCAVTRDGIVLEWGACSLSISSLRSGPTEAYRVDRSALLQTTPPRSATSSTTAASSSSVERAQLPGAGDAQRGRGAAAGGTAATRCSRRGRSRTWADSDRAQHLPADGAKVTDECSTTWDQPVGGLDSRVQIQKSMYPAEFGAGIGAHQRGHQGGGNQFHGSAFEFHRNDLLARTTTSTSASPVPPEPEPVRRVAGWAAGTRPRLLLRQLEGCA